MEVEVSEEERRRAEAFFRKNKVNADEIKSFTFMKDYHRNLGKATETPIITFHLASGEEKACRLSRHQTAVLRFLISKQIPFSNYIPGKRSRETMPVHSYKAVLTQLFDILMVVLCWLLCYAYFYGSQHTTYSYVLLLSVLFIILVPFTTYFLGWKLCYLRFERDALVVRTCTIDTDLMYSGIRKVTFRRTYNKSPRPVMDVIDEEFHYHTYYIGWVPFKSLEEITGLLREAGVDVTNRVRW